MPLLKGQRLPNGLIGINQGVEFNKRVQFRYANPWSKIWFVDGRNGLDTNSGTSPIAAKATVQAAVTVADAEDIIYVRSMGGKPDASDFDYYPEHIIVPYAKENLSIIGVSQHIANPFYASWLAWGASVADTDYVLLNYAPGLSVSNIGFQVQDYARPNGAVHLYSRALTAPDAYAVYAGSVGCTFYNCFFRDGDFKLEGGYSSAVVKCLFQASGNSSASWMNKSSVLPSGGHMLLDSHFDCMFGDNQLYRYVYGIAGAHKDMLIRGCTFGVVPNDNHYMWFGGTNTGLVASCFFAHAAVSTGTDDTNDELYSADGGVKFAGIWDQGGCLGD